MAEKYTLHVEVLFATIDDLEWQFAQLKLNGTFLATHHRRTAPFSHDIQARRMSGKPAYSAASPSICSASF
jgi:hypothetical protein